MRRLAISLVLALSACATNAVDMFRNEGLKRAALDLQCPADALQLQELTPGDRLAGNLSGQVAASGCGHRAVYYKIGVRSWVLNSDVASAKN